MRKMLIVAGLALGAALLTGVPAWADVGCGCVKLGSNPMCVASVSECMSKVGGLCLTPCDYHPPKKMAMKHKSKKKKM